MGKHKLDDLTYQINQAGSNMIFQNSAITGVSVDNVQMNPSAAYSGSDPTVHVENVPLKGLNRDMNMDIKREDESRMDSENSSSKNANEIETSRNNNNIERDKISSSLPFPPFDKKQFRGESSNSGGIYDRLTNPNNFTGAMKKVFEQ